MLTFETESYPAAQETLVFVTSSKGGNERALIAAFNSKEAAQELTDFFNRLAQDLGVQPVSCG